MSIIEKIRAKAAANVKHVVLAEGTEPRTVQAAAKIVALGLAKITLVGRTFLSPMIGDFNAYNRKRGKTRRVK